MPLTYHKTEAGQLALHDRASSLSRRQRSAFIMFDGRRSVEDVLRLTAGLGVNEDDIAHMRRLAYLEEDEAVSRVFSATNPQPTQPPSLYPEFDESTVPSSGQPVIDPASPLAVAQASYLNAYPIATRLTSELGLRGFLLNLAVESAGSVEKLRELAPKIGAAVGSVKFRELEDALR